jgi:hypothetical protein
LFVPPVQAGKKASPTPKTILFTSAATICAGLILLGVLTAGNRHSQRVQPDSQQESKPEPDQKQLRDKQEQAELRKLQEAAQLKAEGDALLASGRFLCRTNEIDDNVMIAAKPTIGRTGLVLMIGIPKEGKPNLLLGAKDITGENSHSEREAISGFDTVRCRIGTRVFSLHKQWSPSDVKIEVGETWQMLCWLPGEDSEAGDLLLHILNSDSPIKVEFSSSFMGGRSYTFTMTQEQLQPMKDTFIIYRALGGAALL